MSDNKKELTNDELSLSDVLNKLRIWVEILKAKWLMFLLLSVSGSAIGYYYASTKPVLYTAKASFVVEDAKGGQNLGGLASLAGQFGLDMGSSGGGVISGDNILLYFKSESLAREVFLSPWDSSFGTSLLDQYAEHNGLSIVWAQNPTLGKIKFPVLREGVKYTRIQDSIIKTVISGFNQESLTIDRPEKKSGFLELTVTSNFEDWSKLYCERLLQVAVKKYVDQKTLRQQKTVDKLQKRVDSIGRMLNYKTSLSASLITEASTMDVNPIYKANSTAQTETTVRDKTMLTTVYAEVVKNLEIAKFTLSQETPVIQIIDTPTYPLKKTMTSKLKSSALGFLMSFLMVSVFLIGWYEYRRIALK